MKHFLKKSLKRLWSYLSPGTWGFRVMLLVGFAFAAYGFVFTPENRIENLFFAFIYGWMFSWEVRSAFAAAEIKFMQDVITVYETLTKSVMAAYEETLKEFQGLRDRVERELADPPVTVRSNHDIH